MKHFKLFFSWQSDRPDVRKIIRDAIDNAVRLLEKEGIHVYVDQDTRDRTGTSSIDSEVLNKIRHCDAFIADLSPVTSYISNGVTKLVPNSNVIFEYGFAKGTIGMNRCILLARMEEGQVLAQFPFDINHDTITTFSDSRRLPSLSEGIKRILLEAEKTRLESQNLHCCSLVFQNGEENCEIRPEFKRVIYTPNGTGIPETITAQDTWTKRRTPSFRLSTNGALVTPISEEINLSLPRISLLFINSGNEALDNCEIRVSANDSCVRFHRSNSHSSFFPDVQTIYDTTEVFDDHIDFKLDDVNPGAEKQMDCFHVFVPFQIRTTVLTWKMTSKRYSQEGVLSLTSEPIFHDTRKMADGKPRIVVEDFIVGK
jgi:hypothetical protein